VEIRFAIMIALRASEIADIDPKRNRHGGTGSKPKSRRMGTTPGVRSAHLMHKQSTITPICYFWDNRLAGVDAAS
jgi:hypothetical protein